MNSIAPSELIINNRGAVYHLDLRPEELADTVITVGDPDRVEKVSRHFDTIEIKRQHREFVTHTGCIGKKRLTVISTGIGPDNIDIVVNELDALKNIDFETRTIKPELSSLNIIRLGTSGALQADIPVDSFVVGTHGLGLDNLLHYYRFSNNAEEEQILAQGFFSILLIAFFAFPKVWAKRTNIFLGFINMAWAIKNFILFSLCRAGECPEVKPGLYITVILAVIVLVMTLLPRLKLPAEKKA